MFLVLICFMRQRLYNNFIQLLCLTKDVFWTYEYFFMYEHSLHILPISLPTLCMEDNGGTEPTGFVKKFRVLICEVFQILLTIKLLCVCWVPWSFSFSCVLYRYFRHTIWMKCFPRCAGVDWFDKKDIWTWYSNLMIDLIIVPFSSWSCLKIYIF